MAGVVSASMPMVVGERRDGNRAFCTFNEGLGKVLRYGANDDEVLDRLAWIRDVLARVFGEVLRRLGEPVDLRAMTAQALQMGDEGHNRNRAGDLAAAARRCCRRCSSSTSRRPTSRRWRASSPATTTSS